MTEAERFRNVLFVLLGAAALVLKPWLVEPSAEIVHCWGGNVAISFACYFLATIPTAQLRFRKLAAAAAALVAVEAFEATDGFGVMSNVYDPIDFVANALGVGLGLGNDLALSSLAARRRHAL